MPVLFQCWDENFCSLPAGEKYRQLSQGVTNYTVSEKQPTQRRNSVKTVEKARLQRKNHVPFLFMQLLMDTYEVVPSWCGAAGPQVGTQRRRGYYSNIQRVKEGTQGRNPRAGTNTQTTEGCFLLAYSLWLLRLLYCIIQDHRPIVALSTVDWVLLQASLVAAYSQWRFFFSNDPSMCKVNKKVYAYLYMNIHVCAHVCIYACSLQSIEGLDPLCWVDMVAGACSGDYSHCNEQGS